MAETIARAELPDFAAVTVETPHPDRRTEHAVQDVLIGIYFIVLMLEDGISPETKLRVIETLLKARREERERELLIAAHREAEALPDWKCATCGEANPGTFQVCWNCSEPQPADVQQLTAESEIALEVESEMNMGREREPEHSTNSRSVR